MQFVADGKKSSLVTKKLDENTTMTQRRVPWVEKQSFTFVSSKITNNQDLKP